MQAIDIILPEIKKYKEQTVWWKKLFRLREKNRFSDDARSTFGTKVVGSKTREEIEVCRVQVDIQPDEILLATITVPIGKCNLEYLQPRLGFESLAALAKSEGYELKRIRGK